MANQQLVKVETSVPVALRKKFRAKLKKLNKTGSEVLRDFIAQFSK